jgi:hypothetical protein
MRLCASGRAVTVLLAGVLLAVVLTVFSCGGLSAKERQQLDTLDPAGVARTFVETKDVQAAEYLVDPNAEQGVPWQVGPLNDLVMTGPYDADIRSLTAYPRATWPLQELFAFEFNHGNKALPQCLWVYVGRRTTDDPWRVLGAWQTDEKP